MVHSPVPTQRHSIFSLNMSDTCKERNRIEFASLNKKLNGRTDGRTSGLVGDSNRPQSSTKLSSIHPTTYTANICIQFLN